MTANLNINVSRCSPTVQSVSFWDVGGPFRSCTLLFSDKLNEEVPEHPLPNVDYSSHDKTT